MLPTIHPPTRPAPPLRKPTALFALLPTLEAMSPGTDLPVAHTSAKILSELDYTSA